MTVDLTFVMDSRENVLLIPLLRVARQGTQDTVLIPGTPQTRAVTLGINDGKQVDVVSGLHSPALSQGALYRIKNFASIQQTLMKVISMLGALLAGVAPFRWLSAGLAS